MPKSNSYQRPLFASPVGKFPGTRYQGSKAKLVDWIFRHVLDLKFDTCLDAFGGTGAVAYRLKQAGKTVTYNDLLRFNYYFGLALIENSDTRLSEEEIDWVLSRHAEIAYPDFVEKTFKDIYFTDDENAWIDQTITNLRHLGDPFKFTLAFFALCQACIIKRPYNLFHRKNLYLRLAQVERSFGNKATWDRPFEEWFRVFASEANQAVFDNGRKNRALNLDAMDVPGKYDLVYIDTPYISKRGVAVDYLDFYHFLAGLTMYYDEWEKHIDWKSKHRRLKPKGNEWIDKAAITDAFDRLLEHYKNSIVIISYRSDGIPSESKLVSILKNHKKSVLVEHFGHYKYVLSNNCESKEILLIGS